MKLEYTEYEPDIYLRIEQIDNLPKELSNCLERF